MNLSEKQDRRSTPFTPAVPLVQSLKVALDEVREETVEGRIARYGKAATFLRKGYARLGIEDWLPAGTPKSNCLTTLRLPAGRTYVDLHDFLLDEGYVIYAGQGNIEKEAYRICNMGDVRKKDYARLLDALEEWLGR